MWRCLVVANQTLGSHELFEALRSRQAAHDDCEFYLLVPATQRTGGSMWTEGEAQAHARRALDDAITRFHDEGIDTDGEVGDADPVLAVADVLNHWPCSEIVVSTFPAGASRWLKRDLPNRLQRRFVIQVTHVAAVPIPAG